MIAEITAIRGFGTWSAQMFLIFFLDRPDVLPTGDLGIRNAVRAAYDLDELPTPAEVERIGEPWRPHRSLASVYLWESWRTSRSDVRVSSDYRNPAVRCHSTGSRTPRF